MCMLYKTRLPDCGNLSYLLPIGVPVVQTQNLFANSKHLGAGNAGYYSLCVVLYIQIQMCECMCVRIYVCM